MFFFYIRCKYFFFKYEQLIIKKIPKLDYLLKGVESHRQKLEIYIKTDKLPPVKLKYTA